MTAPKKLNDVKFSVTYKGQFDLSHLYAMIHDWFRTYGWKSMNGDSDAERSEILYRQNELTGGLREHRIWWRLKRTPETGDEYEFVMNLNLTTSAISKQEIVYAGKKIQADSGEIKIDVTCSMKFLPDETWKDSFHKWMLGMYKGWKRNQILGTWNMMFVECYNLQAHFKKYLNLRQFIPVSEVELFHPSKEYSRNAK